MTIWIEIGRITKIGAICLFVSACGNAQVTSGIYDPDEAKNRDIHEFNRQVDRNLLRPASNAYGTGIPEPVRLGVGNVASNLSLPGTVVNDLLQFRLGDALHNTARFVLNTTLGLGGILDPATDAGLETRSSDFGETMHTWGFGEGAYVELPFLGPSTSRDTVGMTVDFFMNPVGIFVSAPERYVATAAVAAAGVGNRYRFGSTIDSVLYESEDSYAQARLLYLENRRFQLGQVDGNADEELYDLYEESYD